MFFNSLSYIFFLLVVVIVIYIIPGKYQWIWLLICSILFYYTLLPTYLILFFALVVLNYCLGLAIESSDTKRNFVFIVSICFNIIVLVFFKYFGFFQSLAADIKGLSGSDPLLKIILPVGLSFFIFTILSYLIEVKRSTVEAERHIGIFASSLLFFPKMMQGPIEKPGNLFPQFKEVKYFNFEMVVEGLKLILWGYFKKLVVADRLAIYVNAVYNNYEHHSGVSLLVATIFYSFQIYADFSGYTDIAVGSAKVLGFNLTYNFNRPYFANSIKEFWNRWHITLSIWLRDYLFLPLAIYFAGKMKKTKYLGFAAEKWIFLLATIITFLVCGLWHGEGLNFLLWGLLFGIYLTIANWTLGFNKKLRKKLGISKKSTIYRVYGILITFILVSFTWIFFRADNTHDALSIIKSISILEGPLFIDITTMVYSLIGLVLLIFLETDQEFGQASHLPFRTKHWFTEYLAYASLVIIILLIGVFDGGQFIYFQF
jgi:alginate O-acetyltransferase complex protein AlgI